MRNQASSHPGPTRGQWIVVGGLMLAIFMASMESTVVATAMPTIVGQLGGLSIYSWVFSIFMLASTTTVPLYGKLSDMYGRRPLFALAMAFFLIGSFLCAQASSMTQLILFRLIQGLGAGGLQPLVFIMIGDMFSLEQRARMQGFFSGMWGLSSIIGPLIGGFLVDAVSWHWVFYINLLPGLLTLAVITRSWRDAPRDPHGPRVQLDWVGAALLSAAVILLLLGLFELGSPYSWVLLAGAAVLLIVLVWVETRAADPVLPLPLFRNRLFAVSLAHGVFAGAAMFGSTSFVPLFVQEVLGASATVAGSTLTPQLLSWVLASVIGSRLLLHIGYRSLALTGMGLLTVGSFLLANLGSNPTQLQMMISLAMMGSGMGLSIPSFLIAVQSTVPRRVLGVATSTLQFSRSIGGTLGVSLMGAILSLRLPQALAAAGLDPAGLSVNDLLNPMQSTASVATEGAVRGALGSAIESVFVVALAGAVLGLAAVLLAPGGRIAQLMAQGQGESPRAASATSPVGAVPSEKTR